METTKVVCNKEFQIDRVDSRLFGSFLEHMGRVIYSGIYEPDNKNADEDGFRQDVIDRVKEMNVTTVRYPGGNFVSADALTKNFEVIERDRINLILHGGQLKQMNSVQMSL